MPHLTALEWFGYAASVIVAVSLTMSSIVRLRWYNLVGAAAFSTYGFLIHAYPVGVLNGFIALADIYYLVRMYSVKERFQLVRVPSDSEYLGCFFEAHREEIRRIFPRFDFRMDEGRVAFYVLRDLVPACVFVGTPVGDGTLEVDLDFVVPAYRDFKPGAYLFGERLALFRDLGFRRLQARACDRAHGAYLRRVGFQPAGEEEGCALFVRELD
jgi:hypothetical protein